MNKRYKIIILFITVGILTYFYQKLMNKKYLEKFNNTSKLETEPFIGSKRKEYFIDSNSINNDTSNSIPISANKDFKPIGIVPEECIFNDSNICVIKECQGIDWNNPQNVNIICKSRINDYCKGNVTDNGCNKLREIKYNKEMSVKSVQPKFHPSIELPNLVKRMFNINK